MTTPRNIPPKPDEKDGYRLELRRTCQGKYFWEYIPVHRCDNNPHEYDMIEFGRWGWQIATADPQEGTTGIKYCPFCGEPLDQTVKRIKA